MRKSLSAAAFAGEVESQALFPPDASIIVGVSGGVDSMVLLRLLTQLRGSGDWALRLHAAHLHHMLRGAAADADAALVSETCRALGIGLTLEKRDVKRSAKEGVGIEEAGRRERYQFFERAALQTGSEFVAVAHHSDDNAETILHRIIRGTGLRGLAGMAISRSLHSGGSVMLVRPLLSFSRAAILDFAKKEGISFREDSTNAELGATRNQLRHELIPMLEERFNCGVKEALVRLGVQARLAQEYFEGVTARIWESVVLEAGEKLVLDADVLARKPIMLQAELARHAYAYFQLGEQDLSFGHLMGVVRLMASERGGTKITLPHGLLVEKRDHRLVFGFPESR